jgi:hypothetical protein
MESSFTLLRVLREAKSSGAGYAPVGLQPKAGRS